MDLLVTFGVIICVYMLVSHYGKPTSTPVDEKIIVVKKQCPPHQWGWQEMTDQDGNHQGARMMCKLCGPLSDVLDRDVK